ncbi:hypothetical protein BCV69DRAFT_33072 [Microstroma glucosiphilum]|uniref:Uncharacterized protein n=1 Tax=Pseudomicrostroma glucosiphilum TaxID=1684307 RepID=A0A316U3D0_9BASI|nr:hypothetical protein BCV69DRAFT_33072 [Pseudomicrostroma glucosiphilum]PWN19806.1 hypothetical protein BCV69DRAFT_33072 [Pseudomicrostroma glucosiphilum]
MSSNHCKRRSRKSLMSVCIALLARQARERRCEEREESTHVKEDFTTNETIDWYKVSQMPKNRVRRGGESYQTARGC